MVSLDGVTVGAQAIETEIPFVTDDKLLKMIIRNLGGEAR